MYSERQAFDGFGSACAILLASALIMAFLAVKAVVLIIHTFVKYPKKAVLWAFLVGFILFLVAGALLGVFLHNGAFMLLGLVGFSALTLTCYIVELRNSQTMLRQPEPLVKAVLGSSWWESDTTKQAA
jgi:hypothetical protein